MNVRRKIEVFSAGCPACREVVDLINSVACPSCEVEVLDMAHPQVAAWARELGVRSVPAVAVAGKLASCCQGRGPQEVELRRAGLGQPL
jgi:glutaredoxin 3